MRARLSAGTRCSKPEERSRRGQRRGKIAKKFLPHAPARKGPAKKSTRKVTAKTAVKKATRKAPAKKRTRNSLATATVAHQAAEKKLVVAKKAYDRAVVAEARAARNLRKEREDCAKGREAAAFNGHR
jgi:DNA-binding protein HU-beta